LTNSIQSVTDSTRLAGTNQLEILMFRLEASESQTETELFGINVFKVRELIEAPILTQTPEASEFLAGYANIRGKAVPVIDMQKYCGVVSDVAPKILAITEFNRSTQAFLVHDVDGIERLSWDEIKPPPELISAERENMLTAMTVLEDGRMLLIIDVEKVLADVLGSGITEIVDVDTEPGLDGRLVYFADDSSVARMQVAKILNHINVPHESAANGQDALTALKQFADSADEDGVALSTRIQAIVTDVEMPVMDGYVLTRNIKEDKRFNGIPVMMHSSLSADENIRLGIKVGADGYMPKLRPTEFIARLVTLINEAASKAASYAISKAA
jgi:two-component system chemotaxis response regulator CheV